MTAWIRRQAGLSWVVASLLLGVAGAQADSQSPGEAEAPVDDSRGRPSSVAGPITADTTWSLKDSPITVTANTIVASGVTLTVEPGVEVRFEGNATLTVNGTLNARGLPGNEIIWVVAGRRVLEIETPIVVGRQGETSDAAPTSPAVFATEPSFDPETGEIRYTLPEPALVRIRIGVRDGGPLLRTLLDWEPRGTGEHLEVWDGMDDSGTIDFGERSDLMFVLACLPEQWERYPAYTEEVRGRRKAPRFTISFPETTETDETGLPVLSGRVPVRVTVAPDDYRWLSRVFFELVMYVDTEFLMERDEGNNPFTYLLETEGLDAGSHVITMNLIGFEGEIGTASVRVLVDNDPPRQRP